MRIRKAFTLIELLVVISVIAVLMAILMPALRRARDLGQRIVCANHVRSLGLANTLYAEDFHGWFVPVMDRTLGEHRYWPSNRHFRHLVGYLGKQGPQDSTWHAPKQFRCPGDVVAIREVQDRQYTNWHSYGYNLTDWYHTNWFEIGYAGHKTTTVPSPASKIIFTESNDWWAHWPGANYVIGWDVLGHDTISPYKDVGCDGPTLYRHADGVNLAFYDGHVEYRKKDRVWSQEDRDAGAPGMWSVFQRYPPSAADASRLPRP